MFRDEAFDALQKSDAADRPAELTMDEEAFRAFYNRTAAGVWAYIARISGDRQTADDLLQETFYRFLRAGATHDSEAHRRNSVYRIATNLARDAHRRNMVRPWFGLGNSDMDRIPARDEAGETERGTDVNRAMARLKPQERAMLWLAYAEGASHPEIASALGLKTASMKILLFRARRKLASVLRGESPRGEKS
jgi:RNA polymerase sigma-70 factor, ECF subfamily